MLGVQSMRLETLDVWDPRAVTYANAADALEGQRNAAASSTAAAAPKAAGATLEELRAKREAADALVSLATLQLQKAQECLAQAQAEALEAKALMCLRRLTKPRGSDPTVL